MEKHEIAIKAYDEILDAIKEIEEQFPIKISPPEYISVDGVRYYFDPLDTEDDKEN